MVDKNSVLKKIFILISVLVPVLVALILYLPKKDDGEVYSWIFSLPFYNAVINTLTACCLILGVYFVRSGKVLSHKITMATAFILGVFFLVFYIVYHSSVASTSFGGEGAIRYIYFFLLISHILLAFIVVPLVLGAVYFGLAQKIDKHRKIVKYTFPIWLYVSVSGVIIYLMISPYYIN